MKALNFLMFLEKCFKIEGVIFLIFCSSFGLSAQSVIFKKDGTHLTTVKTTRSNNIISYYLESDSTGSEHFISKNAIDSIVYPDGTIERFQTPVIPEDKKKQTTKLLKNSVGLNIWPLFNSKINVYYERLFLNNKLGFKNYFLIDAGNEYYTYGSLNQMADFYYSAGLNYYFLQSYFFRIGTGFSILTGKFNYEYWDPINYFSIRNNDTQIGVLLGVSAYYLIQKRVSSSIGLQIPLGFDFPDNSIIFQTEISFNF